MLRLLLFVLILGANAPSAAAQTPAPAERFTYVTGTALEFVPAGKPGIVDVVPVGTYDSVSTHAPFIVWPFGIGGLPVVVWNNTTTPITHVQVLGTIRTTTGALRAAMAVPVYPGTILPGEFGFTAIPFADQIPAAPAPDDVISFEVFFPEAAPNTRFGPEIIVPLEVTEAEAHDEVVAGAVHGLPPVPEQTLLTAVLCFDPTGTAQDIYLAWDPLWDPPETEGQQEAGHPVAVDLQVPCDRFLVTAQSTFYETVQRD